MQDFILISPAWITREIKLAVSMSARASKMRRFRADPGPFTFVQI